MPNGFPIRVFRFFNAESTINAALPTRRSPNRLRVEELESRVVPTIGLPVSDPFNQADGPLPVPWQSFEGSPFTLMNGHAVAPSERAVATLDSVWGKGEAVSVDVQPTGSRGLAGVVVQADILHRNLYFGAISYTSAGTKAVIARELNGRWSILASTPITTPSNFLHVTFTDVQNTRS